MSKKEKLLKIFTIELEDTIEDLNALIESYRCRLESGAITNYVFRENTSLLTNEMHCIQEYLSELKNIDVSSYKDEREFAGEMLTAFEILLCDHCYAHAVESIVKRKLQKSLDFITAQP